MTAQPFKHDFKEGNVNDLNRAFGYTQALNDIYKHIEQATNDGKGQVSSYIDAVALLDRIILTNDELIKFTEKVVEELEEQLKKEVSASTDNLNDVLP